MGKSTNTATVEEVSETGSEGSVAETTEFGGMELEERVDILQERINQLCQRTKWAEETWDGDCASCHKKHLVWRKGKDFRPGTAKWRCFLLNSNQRIAATDSTGRTFEGYDFHQCRMKKGGQKATTPQKAPSHETKVKKTVH